MQRPFLGFLDRPYLLLVSTGAFWGGNSVLAKVAVDDISPMTLNFGRWLAGAVILLVLFGGNIRADWPRLKAHAAYFLAMGGFGFTGFSALNYLALHHTSAINATIEQSSMPVLVMIGAYLAFGTVVRPLQVVGVGICMLGVAVVALHGDVGGILDLDVNRGDAMMLAASTVFGAYSVFLRIAPRLHWASLITGFCTGASLAAAPLLAIEIVAGASHWPTLFGWGVLVPIILFPTILAQAFYLRGIALIGPSRGGLFINLVPIFGTIFAVLFAGERLESYHLAGLGLALGGIALAEWSARRPVVTVSGQSMARPKVAVRPQSLE